MLIKFNQFAAFVYDAIFRLTDMHYPVFLIRIKYGSKYSWLFHHKRWFICNTLFIALKVSDSDSLLTWNLLSPTALFAQITNEPLP